MTDLPTGAVTFLFTDIEASTRAWDERRDIMEQAVARHDELLREVINSRDGYIFSTAGDSFAAAFSDPGDAVAAALSVQQAVESDLPEMSELRVRVGVHSGVAQERNGDYFGPTLNRAARIMSAGHGGQVLVSHTTEQLVDGRLPAGAALRALGKFRVKDLGASEQLSQLMHPELIEEFPPLRTLDTHHNNLPVELSSFVGRRDELAGALDRLQSSRLVTLTGVGGSGKTRLALQAAAEAVDDFPDGIWVVELASLVDAEELPRWVAAEIGLSRSTALGTATGSSEAIAEYLQRRTALLLIDNCEHVIAAVARFADFLLKASPDLKILATSRESLGVPGEQLIQVPSLRLVDEEAEESGDGETSDAIDLFAERAFAADSTFALTPENAPAVAEVCRRLDGMPLAIELAAARVRLLSPEQIATRLSDAIRLLTGGSRIALPRQQTLRAAIDWSYDLFTDDERAVFSRLAVFRGGFSLDAAEVIVSGDGVS